MNNELRRLLRTALDSTNSADDLAALGLELLRAGHVRPEAVLSQSALFALWEGLSGHSRQLLRLICTANLDDDPNDAVRGLAIDRARWAAERQLAAHPRRAGHPDDPWWQAVGLGQLFDCGLIEPKT